MTDWSKLEEEMGGKYKNFAADGPYDVKCNSIEIKEVGQNGSIIMKFGFEETDVQFPTADHWLTFKEGKDNWRKWHNRCLMVVLGATKDAAQKAVDVCESKDSKDAIVKAYEAAFKKLISKKPAVKIEVFTENNYARAEFADRSVAFPHGEEKQSEPKGENILEQGEPLDLDDSLPF